MVVALPDVEVAAVVDSDSPVFVVSAGGEIDEQLGAVAFRRHAETVAAVLGPEEMQHRLESVTVKIFFRRIGDFPAFELPYSFVNIVKFDKLARKAEPEPPERIPRRPELDRIGERRLGSGADEIVLIVPAHAAVAFNRKFKMAVEEMRLDDSELGALVPGTGGDIGTALLPAAAEEFAGGEEIEVVLTYLGRNVDRIHGRSAHADHERTGVLLFHFVDEIAVLRAVRILAAVARLEIISYTGEIVKILKTLLTALGAVGKHPVAGAESDFTADHLVLGIVVAADFNFVDHNGNAFGDFEDNINHTVFLRRNALYVDTRVGEPEIAGTDRYHNPMRGVDKLFLACAHARLRKFALGLYIFLGIARKPDDRHLSDPIRPAFRDVEAQIDLVFTVRHTLGTGDFHIQKTFVAENFRDFVAAARKLVVGDRLVGEPSHRIPPRIIADRFAQNRIFHRIRPVEKIIVDLETTSFIDHELDRGVVAFANLRNRRDLRVGEILLLIRQLHLSRRDGEIGLSVKVAVLEISFLGNARFAEKVVAFNAQRSGIAQFAFYLENDLHAARYTFCVGADGFKFTGILERIDVTRERDRIVDASGFCLTPYENRAGITAETVQHLYFDISDVRSVHCGSTKREKRENFCIHACILPKHAAETK